MRSRNRAKGIGIWSRGVALVGLAVTASVPAASAWAPGGSAVEGASGAAVLNRAQEEFEQGNTELQKGIDEIAKAQSAATDRDVVESATQAQTLIANAIKKYDAAYKAFESEYKKLPVFIDDKTPEGQRQIAYKGKIFGQYIEARFQAGVALFQLGRCYRVERLPVSAATGIARAWNGKATEANQQALDRFQSIYDEYRRQLAGQYAYLWLGRCFVEKGDHRRALGIFEHLGSFEGHEALAPLAREAFRYRIESYNATNEYDLVVAQAEPWLEKNAPFASEPTHPAVRFQLAGAHASLAKTAPSASERSSHLQKARQLYQVLADSKNEQQQASQRELGKLD